jgi:ABC-type branched-subunit amino acid transport system substrate-binding protein
MVDENESGAELDGPRTWLARRLTRRSLIRYGAGAGTALAGGALLVACGSSSSSSKSTAGSSSAAGASSAAATAATSAPAASSQVGSQLREILGIPSGTAAGEGMTIQLGGDFALSGAGSSYGIPMYQGALHGIAHIKAAGGPNYKFVVRDSPATDPVKGTANTREFGSLGIPAILTSQGGGDGGGAPFYNKYKMWAIDSGAALLYNDGKPYFYQGRAAFTAGLMPVITQYLKTKRPEVKKLTFLTFALTGTLEQLNLQTVNALKQAGYEVQTVAAAPGTSDWATPLSQVAQQQPDMIVSQLADGQDAGLMLKSYLTAGINKKIVGVDYTPQYAQIAGPEAIKAYEFCFDYFDAQNPGNDWAKLFVESWRTAYNGAPPIYYSANFYESAFTIWDLVRRIIAKGGDPTKQGNLYVDALNENAVFSSVYGSPGAKYGSMTFDLSTHALKHRPIAYGQALADGTGTIYASADTTGSGFALTPAGMKAPSSTAATAV